MAYTNWYPGVRIANTESDPVIAKLSGSTSTEGGAPPAQIVAVGGRYDATPRTLQPGQFAAIALTPEGRVIVEMMAQDFLLFSGVSVAAGASVSSSWIDVNGYNSAGIFVDFPAGLGTEQWSYRLHVSPNNGVRWAYHPDTQNPISMTGRPHAVRHTIGHAKYLRFQFTNNTGVDINGLVAYLQLVF